MSLTVTRSPEGALIENLTPNHISTRGLEFPPGARWLDYRINLVYHPNEVEDGLDETDKIVNGYPNKPRFGGWAWPWGYEYGGATGGTGIRHVVTADSQEELVAMQLKLERVVARHPSRRYAVNKEVFGHDRFDDQHLVRFSGPCSAMAEQGCPLAKKLLVDEAMDAITDQANLINLAFLEEDTAKRPNAGTRMGRAHGHRMVLLAKAARYADPHKASLFLEHARRLRDVMEAAVTTIGTVQRNDKGEFYNGHGQTDYWQAYEHCILLWGLWAWRDRWWELGSYQELLRAMTVDLMDSELWGMAGAPGLVKNAQVGDDWAGPLHSAKVETAHTDDLYAIAYYVTGDSSYLRKGHPIGRSPAGNGVYWRKALIAAQDGAEAAAPE